MLTYMQITLLNSLVYLLRAIRRRAGRRRADDYPAVQGRGYVYPFIIYLLCHLRQLHRQNFF